MIRRLFNRIRQAVQNVVNPNQGITISRDAFSQAQRQLSLQAAALRSLRAQVNVTFANLRVDWDSAAGRAFFNKFENELLAHIDQYANKLEARSQSLTTVANMYNEVFQAADAVANARYG